jgi:probable FeS assembly SUF system protein SufT
MMEMVLLSRDCEAVLIPMGTKVILKKEKPVRITQSLGGSYTVITEEGYMARIAGKDGDALGKEAAQAAAPEAAPSEITLERLKKDVWEQLKTCYDPEIPVNIADLGLIYKCEIEPLPEGGHKVFILMTLTAPGCGMGEALRADAQHKVSGLPGVKQVNVELTFDPPWNPSRLTEAAKLQLGML